MVPDSELTDRLQQILTTADLTITTTASIRRQLEHEFGIDLTDKKAFIREQIDIYIQNQQPNENEEEEPEEVEEDEVEEDSNGKSGSSRKLGSKKGNKEVKKKGGGFTKLCTLSPQLQKFTGVPELARTEVLVALCKVSCFGFEKCALEARGYLENTSGLFLRFVVKQLWSYIREHDLQDPANRRNIRCDGRLQELFGVDTIDMFQMNKALAKHIWPLNSDGGTTFPSYSAFIFLFMLTMETS
ncbi:putative transcription regulator SWI/SNF-BAF60b family [Helianthus annuus]|nr:putative transcription regulator SWI/SNF-BAF60b family [Helianthus annuus]